MSAPVYDAPYPVSLDLADRPVLVVGGGPVAARKAGGLVAAGARVTVVSPTAVPELADHPVIRWHQRAYRRGEVASYRLAITATDDARVNAQVARDGEAANVFVNSADDPANCAFILPSVVQQGDLQVAVSTNGRSPAMSRWLRRQLEELLTPAHAQLLDLLAGVRDEAQRTLGSSEVPGWDESLDDGLLDLVRDGQLELVRETLRTALGLSTSDVRVASS